MGLSKNLFAPKKLLRIPATNGGKKVKSVISGDMCLGNDTSHDAAAEQPSCKPFAEKALRAFSAVL